MKITRYKTKNNDIIYYLARSVRDGKKVKTIIIEKLGNHSDLIKLHDDPLAHLKAYAKELTLKEKEDNPSFLLDIKQNNLISNSVTSKSTSLNIGYFFLNAIYKELNLDKFFKKVILDTKIEYDPNLVTKFLTFSRILEPKSKLGTYDDFKNYYEKPNIKLQDIYKTLDLLTKNLDSYQQHLYKESLNIKKRNTKILYYDCTNYFFEIETDDDFRKYGQSKENRPNPLVQMGLFLDADGIPLAFNINPGNTNEQTTAIPLEKKIVKDFELSNFIYVADGGLNSNDIRLYNSFNQRDYIVTQSLKKLKQKGLDLIMTDDNWKLLSDNEDRLVNIKDINDDDKNTYYKVMTIDNPIDVGLRELAKNGQIKKKTNFKQTLIVTYKKSYSLYQNELRLKQIQRANDLIKSNRVNNTRQTSPKRLIKQEGDISYDIDLDKIREEMKYDGFYALVTSLENDSVKDILKASAGRWEIEESFRILKTNFKTRPVFLRKENRIKAHFTICFTALLIYRLLEKKLDSKYTIDEIIKSLRDMNVLELNMATFKSSYTGSKILEDLCIIFNKQLNKNIYTNVQLNKNK